MPIEYLLHAFKYKLPIIEGSNLKSLTCTILHECFKANKTKQRISWYKKHAYIGLCFLI